MRGYPKYFATKEDYENIIRDFPEWRERVKGELIELKKINDSKVKRAIRPIDPDDPESEWITEEIDNPLPRWKQKGFKMKKELDGLIIKAECKSGDEGVK
jgi:hypothetical protein